jgi:hypothetical protein
MFYLDSTKQELIKLLVTSYGIAYPPNENVGEKIWGDFVPNALASGKLQAKPDPIIVGHGLEELQKGLDLQKAGVSAKKLVIMLYAAKQPAENGDLNVQRQTGVLNSE